MFYCVIINKIEIFPMDGPILYPNPKKPRSLCICVSHHFFQLLFISINPILYPRLQSTSKYILNYILKRFELKKVSYKKNFCTVFIIKLKDLFNMISTFYIRYFYITKSNNRTLVIREMSFKFKLFY